MRPWAWARWTTSSGSTAVSWDTGPAFGVVLLAAVLIAITILTLHQMYSAQAFEGTVVSRFDAEPSSVIKHLWENRGSISQGTTRHLRR
jgi:hypothetical protein